MKRILTAALVIVICLAAAGRARAAEPLAERVRQAIERGKKYLINQEAGRGNWEVAGGVGTPQGGQTALAMLALLHAGVPPNDPVMQRGLKYLRALPLQRTYVVSLQTMVYALAGQAEDKDRIQRGVDWLVEARVMSGNLLQGWTYTDLRGQPDNSNTQYALLGLHEGHVAGAKIDRAVWESIRDFYARTQNADGGWGYQTGQASTATMTVAGLCGLIIAGLDLNAGREKLLPNGQAQDCGVYEKNRELEKALDWVGSRFPSAGLMERMGNTLYWIYGVERAGRLTGQRFFGRYDWYREGCDFLVKKQNADDSWIGRGHGEGNPIVGTSFALLFLSKGRTPILMSKLAHEPGDDWNNDRNDARNLVEFTRRELFKNQPLGWQVFDVRRAGDESKDMLLADLVQSPILYFNGHRAPQFTGVEVEGDAPLLRQYVEQGGFIFAEACCDSPDFDRGFRALMKKLFPDIPLKELAPEHPIWRASGKFAVTPGEPYKLYGIEMGCKTVVVYSPTDLSCRWESNQFDQGEGRVAFRLGANIIAYATGMEPPKARQFELKAASEADTRIERGFLKVAQLRHDGDWQPAPRAMRNLMAELRKDGLDVVLQTEAIRPTPDAVDYKFLYMHGRAAFSYSDEEMKHLRFNLETGGLILADACCGSKTFDKAFREFAAKLWPDKMERQLTAIPLNDELYSRELNNEAITRVRCRREGADGRPDPEYREVEPLLEGIKVNGRWVVIYSKYDLGCALEKMRSTECLGHDYASAVRLGTAAVLYAMKR